jgi:threonine aldolase
MKSSFKNDYSEGCHPRILQALGASNLEQHSGYGADVYCQRAAALIVDKIASPYSTVHFVSGGTQANLVVIASILRPHESVIAAATGHIFDNEAGAIEATGHKVNAIGAANGKMTPALVQHVLDSHSNKPHQLKQKLVYISNSTEIGTHYSRAELEGLSRFCRAHDLYLFMDGARLGHALTAESNDLTLADIAALTDVFYIGGTKNGALLGEAIVINNPELQGEFEFYLKQKGAMLAKGRLLGIQFLELFKDNLYFELARQANSHAMRIKQAFEQMGCDWWADTATNQIFPILDNVQIERLLEQFDFYVWRRIDATHSAIRIITSWATQQSQVDALIAAIQAL